MGVMILEIDNMLRSIGDIRKALLSLEDRGAPAAAEEVKELADEMEFKVRDLEFELNEAS